MKPRRPALLAGLAAILAGPAALAAGDGVFGGPPAPPTPVFRPGVPAPGGPLRVLTVEDRVGVARRGELVRVPLFFHAGECPAPESLALFAADDAARARPLPYQADDIRRDDSGQVSRMHLYFETDLPPWQRRQFHLVAGRDGRWLPPAPAPAASNGCVTLGGRDLAVTFLVEGPQAGAITRLETPLGAVAITGGVLGPQATLIRQDAALKIVRETPFAYAAPDGLEIRHLAWGTGPLFDKLVVRVGPKGVPDAAEFTYRIPRQGALMTQTARFLPEEADTPEVVGVRDFDCLHGPLRLGGAGPQAVLVVPAGLRRLTRLVHGFSNPALVNPDAGLSLLAVPYVQSGDLTVSRDNRDGVAWPGPTTFRRHEDANSGSLRAFWGETRYVFSRAVTGESLWELGRAHQQTLTALVDEPGLGPDDLSAEIAALSESFYGITQWGRGWQQTAAMAWLTAKSNEVERLLGAAATPGKPGRLDDTQVEAWLPAWVKTPGGQRPPPKRGELSSGRLDPYMVTFASGSIVPFAALVRPAERLDRVAHAVGQGSRITNGGVDPFGFPYIQCFSGALNMQCGSILFGLYGGARRDDAGLALFARDVARQQGVLAVYGRGQRTYSSLQRGPVQSDLLYEALSDLHLRTAEWICQEDLWLHPAVFGRYADCVDVLADQAHRTLNPKSRGAGGRANFFRGQSHDHRWEAWDAAPFVGLLAHPADAVPPGLTEACYFVRNRVGTRVNWSELFTFFHTEINLRLARARYRPPVSPPLPLGVSVRAGDGGTIVTWQPVPGDGIASYRVYRAARMGGPWTWLNSPYVATPLPPLREARFADTGGKPGDTYWVTAVNAAGRESRWFADEPAPR